MTPNKPSDPHDAAQASFAEPAGSALPCPFCGCQDAFWRIKDDNGAWLQCSICKAHGPKAPIEGMAAYEWNRRHHLKVQLLAAEEALAKHKQSAFHETHPCGGCHWWQGYIAAVSDIVSGQWHSAMSSPNTQVEPPAAKGSNDESN